MIRTSSETACAVIQGENWVHVSRLKTHMHHPHQSVCALSFPWLKTFFLLFGVKFKLTAVSIAKILLLSHKNDVTLTNESSGHP